MNTNQDKKFLGFVTFMLFYAFIYTSTLHAQPNAQSLFKENESLVYQIRVIDIASGDKFSIGSGFRIGKSGYLATNFHVVSSYVHKPEKYRLEYVAADASEGDLELLAVDVVHDLAIVDARLEGIDQMKASEAVISKGERIYSMGNPQDLGMTIIEGTYNGLIENSRYRKILFSGSLNAGMSGGPALNADGEVIGVNVSKGGEQLSFLVPVEHLFELLSRVESDENQQNFSAVINKDLTADQDKFYSELISLDIQKKQLGSLVIPNKLHESLRCWGHTVDEEDIKYEAVHQHCKSDDEIFISGNLFVGRFNYDVEMISTDNLNRFQFYSFLEKRFTHPSLWNASDRDDVTDYNCTDSLVSLNSGNWKISTCFRAYKDYIGLYDASLIMVSMDYSDYAAIVKMAIRGASKENAVTVFKRITEATAWKR